MKKIFTLLALMCMVCTGAWAFDLGDLQANKKVVFRSYWTNTKYMKTNAATSKLVVAESEPTAYVLIAAPTASQYYLYDAANGVFIGKTASTASNQLTVTGNAAVAGIYTFVQSTASDSGKDTTTPRISIVCQNPGTSTYPRLHSADGSTVLNWDNTASGGGNAWHIYSVEDATTEEIAAANDKILADQISTVQETVNTMYDNRGKVGYPTNMESIAEYVGAGKVNSTNLTTVQGLISALFASNDVKMPEAGKAYHIYNVTKNGTKRIIYYDGTTLKITANGTTTAPADKEDLFICGKDGATFFFTNNLGNYMRVSSSDKNKPASGNYGEMVNSHNVNALTISHMATVNSCTDAQRYGLLMIKGYADFSGANGEHYLMGSNAQNFVQGGAGLQMFTDAAQSIAFSFEEVENPNTFTLSNPNPYGTASLDGKSVGTFSAPYNVKFPSTVTAYVAATREGDIISLDPIEGNVVPANTGVLLYAEGGETFSAEAAVPAAETMPTISSNNFVAVVNGIITEGSYVLANDYHGVAFYPRANDEEVHNKAYLDPTFVSGVRGFVFTDNGLTTAIATPVAQQTTATAFDLAGRRVNAAVKGISIVNGKKFIK